MKLKIFLITAIELQDYLDKYEDKIKFILVNNNGSSSNPQGQITLIIDVA